MLDMPHVNNAGFCAQALILIDFALLLSSMGSDG